MIFTICVNQQDSMREKKKIKPFSCVLRRTSCLDIHLDSIQFPQCFTGKYNSCKVADFYTEHIYDLRENNKKV